MGGANGGDFHALAPDFRIFVPKMKGWSPITHSSHEGVGVQPDIIVSTKEAFPKAYHLALEQLLSSADTPYKKKLVAIAVEQQSTIDKPSQN